MFDRLRNRVIQLVSLASLLAVATVPAAAQERVDEAAIARIKAEGLERSQVMETASWLTDVFGARLTGSPNIKAAGEWDKRDQRRQRRTREAQQERFQDQRENLRDWHREWDRYGY